MRLSESSLPHGVDRYDGSLRVRRRGHHSLTGSHVQSAAIAIRPDRQMEMDLEGLKRLGQVPSCLSSNAPEKFP